MSQSQKLTPLGKVTLFYVPSNKLDVPGPAGQGSPRGQIHDFLMGRYQAYTHTPSAVKGFWLDQRDKVQHDVLERFEVSFQSEQEFQSLIDFLRDLCRSLDEQAIYLTRGDESFLVHRSDEDTVRSE
jgi:hypothetical protein